MMENMNEELDEWERRHQATWLGRSGLKTGSMDWGTGISMQADLMSPLSIVEFAKDPSVFNLMKAGYNPTIAYAGYSLAQWMTGTKIGFAERILHSADMARATSRNVIIGTARTVRGAGPWIAGLTAMGAGIHAFWHTVRSLDWVPDYHVGP